MNCLLPLTLLLAVVNAQFPFFGHMFGGGGNAADHAQNFPSDSAWYRSQHDNAHCDRYLCPGTLSCVHFPHHCPCAWPEYEDKVELGEGSMVCVSKVPRSDSKGGLKKIELARKGLV
ncbi:hypothetical protein K470DRAFT_248778 [Piedraia hortae CBS 480.64]|uniref:Long chronological lifespan protein 2 n=1 Tax=Piedraia hortae CBS 480.64 TaxID=1314780 RepID=A0A6A7BXQ1_9PEZI|nr:hypothetical protein K470DRAFT_248778 [Piedraia hortae CBS 480.64]